MQDNISSQQPIRVPVSAVNAEDLIRQLLEDNKQLRKIIEGNNAVIDRLTNSMAFQQ